MVVKFEPGCRISTHRGIGSAISASIQAAYPDYLISSTDYTASSTITNTAFTSDIKSNYGCAGRQGD